MYSRYHGRIPELRKWIQNDTGVPRMSMPAWAILDVEFGKVSTASFQNAPQSCSVQKSRAPNGNRSSGCRILCEPLVEYTVIDYVLRLRRLSSLVDTVRMQSSMQRVSTLRFQTTDKHITRVPPGGPDVDLTGLIAVWHVL